MSIITVSKSVTPDMAAAVSDFLRKAEITVVPARKRKHTMSKTALIKRERAIAERLKLLESQTM